MLAFKKWVENLQTISYNDTQITLLRVPMYRPNRQYKARTAEMA